MADDTDGFAVVEQVNARFVATRFLALSGYIDANILGRMAKSQIHGFVDKNWSSLDGLKAGIEAIAAGRAYYSDAFQAARIAARVDPCSPAKVLSNTELRLLPLIGKGLDNYEIGQAVGIKASTAQTHRRNIFYKLGIRCTPKLIAYAMRHGFVRAIQRVYPHP